MHVLSSLRHRGYDAEGVEDGTQTLARPERGRFGAVVAGVQMPGMDGLGLLREIRSLGHRVPVAVHSSSVGVPAEALFRRAGAFRVPTTGGPMGDLVRSVGEARAASGKFPVRCA